MIYESTSMSKLWLPVLVASVCVALSALSFMVLPRAWETPLFWKLLPAITGILVAMFGLVKDVPLGTPFPSDTKYFFAFLFGINAGIISFSVDTAPLYLRLSAWAISLTILSFWPWITAMHMATPFATRFTLTTLTISLLSFVIFTLIGVPTYTGIALLWLAFVAALFTWYMYWKQSQTLLVFLGAIGIVAHMTHAVLIFTPMAAFDDFYTALPIFIFYASVPAFAIYRFQAGGTASGKTVDMAEYSLY